ncbi:MAG: hypothetical protein C4523_10710 [Myxococcales bacterium]|jgi:hypothetical protein|nr:MAG: hypothetical protein C4523_10710 [Myxococcales bacterium]
MAINTSAAEIAAKWVTPDKVEGLELDIVRLVIDHSEQVRTASLTKMAIEVEKMLCGLLNKDWSPSGMSIETLVEDLRARHALQSR